MEIFASGEQTSWYLPFGPAEFSDNILEQFGYDSDRGIPPESLALQVLSCQLNGFGAGEEFSGQRVGEAVEQRAGTVIRICSGSLVCHV